MENSHYLNYLQGYPPGVLDGVRTLAEQGRVGNYLLGKYPKAHHFKSDKQLFVMAQDLRQEFLARENPLSKCLYDGKIRDLRSALGTHTAATRVHGSKLKTKNEIRVATCFRTAPEAFLRMIVVHELAHFRYRDHDKNFYRLCEHMEPDYHYIEMDVRIYLGYRDAGSPELWQESPTNT
jgi:predicted metal-dependent hydrolase